MKNALLKDAFLEIKNNFKRFMSILLIVLLGVGFFAGIKATSPGMKNTVDKYYTDKSVMDIKIVSTLGLTTDDIAEVDKLEEVESAYGSYSTDAIINFNNDESVVKILSIIDNNSSINQITLTDGRLPETEYECVIEKNFLEDTNSKIGDEINIILDINEDSEPFLKNTNLKIVGIVESPLYISFARGSTNLLSGKIHYYMYVPESTINSEIFTEIYVKLKDVSDYHTFSTKYDEIVENATFKLEQLAPLRESSRYDKIVEEANVKISDAQNELNEEKTKYEKEIADAEKKINNAKKKIKDAENTIKENEEKANSEFGAAYIKLQEAENQINSNQALLDDAKNSALAQFAVADENLSFLNNTLNSTNLVLEQLNSQKSDLKTKQNQLQTNIQDLTALLSLATDPTEIDLITNQLSTVNTTLVDILSGIAQIDENIKKADSGKQELESNITIITTQLINGKTELVTKEALLVEARQEIIHQRNILEETKKTTFTALENAKKELKKGKSELQDNIVELEDAKIEAKKEFNDAQTKIDDSRLKISELEKPTWYILDRNMNQGYVSYSQDTDRIGNIGRVFPMIFFVVAALISLTSITRIIEEQRIQIGTLKALGYSKLQISLKYFIYAFLATCIGGIIGMLIGFSFLPKIVFNVYKIIYTLPPIVPGFNLEYASIGLSLALCCTIGATIYSCTKELSNTPSNLMRPKAPTLGKRVLLENFTFVWSRLNFLKKVTLRNMFRYKKRFLMTIIGISGCTSLIVAGFGLRDSISHMIPAQYGEVFKYQFQITLNEDTTSESVDTIINNYNLDNIKANMQSVQVLDNTQVIQLIVPENTKRLNNFIELKSRNKSTNYSLNDTTAIISEKIANLMGIKVGDTIQIKNTNDKIVSVTIGNITENYLMHYIYMSPTLYESLFNETLNYNVLFANSDISDEKEVTKNLLLESSISSVTLSSDSMEYFSEVLDRMNIVIWILIISAGILALVVLYNLSNINISERIREIATIKVLGFHNNEVYQYISRETVLLTIIGIICGLFFGYFLNIFILNTCELDNTMFARRIETVSYIYSISITLIFSYIVNIMTYFTLKKVNMIESLKSIE